MEMDRRTAVQLGTAATLGALLPRSALAAAEQNATFETAFQETLSRLKAAFSDLGIQEVRPLPIATQQTNYNGGLRHDFDQSALPAKSFIIQPLARVGDVEEKSRPDVLPLFHEVGCHPDQGTTGQQTTEIMLRLLTEALGLDPARIAFVSVPQADDMGPVLGDLGFPFAEKVLLRNEAEALAARDASGFFFPDPFGDAYLVTMGVYYRIGERDEISPTSYPPSGNWTEIGEIVIAGEAAPLGLSIGAERLTLALTGLYPSWDQRLGALSEQVIADSGGTEPPGLAAFR